MNEKSVNTLEFRPTLIMLCSINCKISIHTNINKKDNKEAIPINNKSDRKYFLIATTAIYTMLI